MSNWLYILMPETKIPHMPVLITVLYQESQRANGMPTSTALR